MQLITEKNATKKQIQNNLLCVKQTWTAQSTPFIDKCSEILIKRFNENY